MTEGNQRRRKSRSGGNESGWIGLGVSNQHEA